MARKWERAIVPKILREIREVEAELELLTNDAEKDVDERTKEAEKLTKRLADLKRKQHLKKCTDVAVRYRIESESMSKSWTESAKTTKPWELIYALQKPGVETDNPYEKNSMKMAELARDYHENLQKHDIAVGTVEREECINSSLAAI